MTTALAIPDLLGTGPADLLRRLGDQPDATADVARARADRIRSGLASYTQMRQDIAEAYAQRDWVALGYGSWGAYVEAEYADALRQLGRTDRREVVADLRQQGMSTRQIAAATGVSQPTVLDDLKVKGSLSPETVNGSDGKQYPATKPASPLPPAPEPPAEPERPKPPKWDPEERRVHEAEVHRLQVIQHGQQAAKTIVTEVQALVVTVVSACREGEDLVTPQMIAELRKAVDLLEGEIR